MDPQSIDALMTFLFATKSGSFVLMVWPFATLILLSWLLRDKKRSVPQNRVLAWTMGIAAICWLGVVIWMLVTLFDPWGIRWCAQLMSYMVFLGFITAMIFYPIVAGLAYLTSRDSRE